MDTELDRLEKEIEQNTTEFKGLTSQRKFDRSGKLIRNEELENKISQNKSEWIELVNDADNLRK